MRRLFEPHETLEGRFDPGEILLGQGGGNMPGVRGAQKNRKKMPKIYNSIIVPAPIEQVWSRICDFHDFSWAPSLVGSCEKVGEGNGYCVGARRLLNGVFLDTLIAYDSIEKRMMYSMDEGPSPVSSREIHDYIGNLHLLPITADNTTFTEWSASWESANTDAIEYMNLAYRSLLSDLAARFGVENQRGTPDNAG